MGNGAFLSRVHSWRYFYRRTITKHCDRLLENRSRVGTIYYVVIACGIYGIVLPREQTTKQEGNGPIYLHQQGL